MRNIRALPQPALEPPTPIDFSPRSIFSLQSSSASGLDLPLFITGPSDVPNGSSFRITNNDTSGSAISANGPTWGIISFAGDTNPYPPVNVPAGLFGVGEAVGTGGSSSNGSGVLGITNFGYAGEFRTFGTNNGIPLWAHTNGINNAAIIEIDNASSSSSALVARTISTTSSVSGVHGIIESTAPGSFSAALRGENRGTGGSGIGVFGSHQGAGWGVYGTTISGRGVYGLATTVGGAGIYGFGSGGANAGTFSGNVSVSGTLSKGSGTFKIDHPNDPANMYLSHSFVESPDMKNIYDGVVTLDESGTATVTMPSYFDALNTEFRYQLTCIGGYAPVYISEEINERQFAIAGGSPWLKVSWQITGIRQDPFALANPVRVEEEKSSDEKGLYLHPELYGQPQEKGIGYTAQPMPSQN